MSSEARPGAVWWVTSEGPTSPDAPGLVVLDDALALVSTSPTAAVSMRVYGLTAREQEAARLVLRGATTTAAGRPCRHGPMPG